MRIIAGNACGVQITAPKGLDTRPTSDRVREALFNIIADRVPGAVFLDLFAGTGAVGLEALSRGASFAAFSDIRAESVACVRRNAEKTRLLDKTRILRADAARTLKIFADEGLRFDIVFIDPPYGGDLALQAVLDIMSKGLLNRDGLIVAEQSSDTIARDGSIAQAVAEAGLNLMPGRERRYGSTVLEFFVNSEDMLRDSSGVN